MLWDCFVVQCTWGWARVLRLPFVYVHVQVKLDDYDLDKNERPYTRKYMNTVQTYFSTTRAGVNWKHSPEISVPWHREEDNAEQTRIQFAGATTTIDIAFDGIGVECRSSRRGFCRKFCKESSNNPQHQSSSILLFATFMPLLCCMHPNVFCLIITVPP